MRIMGNELQMPESPQAKFWTWIVGIIVESIRLPGAMALGGIAPPFRAASTACSWLKLFIWLLRTNPVPSTITPEPKSAPRV